MWVINPRSGSVGRGYSTFRERTGIGIIVLSEVRDGRNRANVRTCVGESRADRNRAGRDAAVVAVIISLNTPSSRLVAEIRPMAFRLPVTDSQLAELTKTDKPVSPALGPLMQASRATGLVKIDLYNNGDFPVSAIHINVSDAFLYAKRTEGVDDSSVLPSDLSGITLDSLTQGSSITIYAWTGTQAETYRHWANLDDKFKITYSQGVARKYIYIEGGWFSGWWERNWFSLR